MIVVFLSQLTYLVYRFRLREALAISRLRLANCRAFRVPGGFSPRLAAAVEIRVLPLVWVLMIYPFSLSSCSLRLSVHLRGPRLRRCSSRRSSISLALNRSVGGNLTESKYNQP